MHSMQLMAAFQKVRERLCIQSEIRPVQFTPDSAARLQIVFIITLTLDADSRVDVGSTGQWE